MAEKPRLKDTDEIFSSLRNKRKAPPPLPNILGREEPPAPATPSGAETPPEVQAEAQAAEGERDAEPEKRPASRRSRAPKRQAEPEPPAAQRQPEPAPAPEPSPVFDDPFAGADELPEPVEDKQPLDFGKYQLPSREELAAEVAMADAAVAPDPVVTTAQAGLPDLEPVSAPARSPRRRGRRKEAAREQAAAFPEVEEVQTEEGPKLVQPYRFEDLSLAEEPASPPVQEQQAPPAVAVEETPTGRKGRKTAEKAPAPQEEPVKEEQPAEQAKPEQAKPAETKEEADERADFLKRLSSQFEEEFTQRFEGRDNAKETVFDDEPPPPPAQKKSRCSRRRKGPALDLAITPKEEALSAPAPVAPPPATIEPDAEFLVPPRDRPQVKLEAPPDGGDEAEADSFLEQFAQQVREEESERVEQFKDTLEEKFERERARYLKELGIAGLASDGADFDEVEDEPGDQPGFRPPEHRRLDLHIQPDMHRSADDGPQPVTYSRNGVARPLDDVDDGSLDDPFDDGSGEEEPDGKKSSEQLLLELARQNTNREAAAQKALERQLHKQFQFVTPEEEAQRKEQQEKEKAAGAQGSFFSRHRIGVLSAVAAVLVLALLAIPLMQLLGPQGAVEGGGGSTTQDGAAISGDAYTILETRNFEERGEFEDVIIKRSNISVTNMTVNNLLVIDEITSPGDIRLENVTVGGALYLQNCAVDSLTLHNVSAQRIVLSNNESDVTVTISGTGMVETVEVKTPAKINSIPQQGAEGYGVRDVVLRGAQSVDTLNVSLSGMDLVSLAAYGSAVLDLDEDTFVERMSIEGSLALSGPGRILTLTAGPEGDERSVLSLGDANISHLNVKGEAEINLTTQVDTMVVADHFTLTGSGRVSMLTVDARLDGGRLLGDLTGVDVQTLISNTETRVNVMGGGRVGELTANDSVYALGNKVSHLVVNADGVIYQNEPDKITVASGVRPPETMADNPNLDYNLSSEQNTLPIEAEDDDIATVCGHSRDSGGFLRGDGSRSNPYEVSTPAQLAHISSHLDSHFIQTADIDISDDTQFITGFPMIAADGSPFSGSYDGNGYEILNLRISSDAENIGLFAENIGTVQNVTIASGEVKTSGEERSFVGSLVGLNYQGGVVENCSNGARVSGNASSYVGGLVGYNYGGRVRNSYNMARVSGTYNVGGIAGVNRDDAVISGSYNAGTVDGTSETGSVVGTNSEGIVTNCYYLVNTADEGIGSGTGTATARTSDEMATDQMVADLSAGSDASPWVRGSGGYTYPMLDIATRTTSSESSSSEPPSGTEEVIE